MATALRIWNKRDPNIPADAIYVGRPTMWGNPYVVGRDGTRAEVVAKHARMVESSPSLKAAAKRVLRGHDLVCWCWPLPCHATTWLKVANE